MRVLFLLTLFIFFTSNSVFALTLFEDFNKKGKPQTANSVKWSYKDQLLPVKGWSDIVPGDGFAYLTFDTNSHNDRLKNGKKNKWPFQMLEIESVEPGHSLEMRAKNCAILGVASFIFTYVEFGKKFDEIDIEIAAYDKNAHNSNNKLTNIRLNSWANSSLRNYKPEISHKQPIKDAKGNEISIDDNRFHTFRIDWYKDHIDFYIDDVYQQTIKKLVPKHKAKLLVGVRHMSWCGKFNWKGKRSFIVDWIKVKPLKDSK